MHFVDQLVDFPERRWLAERCWWIAEVTLGYGGVSDVDVPGRTVWRRRTIRPDTMEHVTVTIVLDENGHEVITVFAC